MSKIRVNMRAKVDNAAIRHEVRNGREHIVVPSFTLPDNIIMNGIQYPRDEVDKSYKGLEGTLAPLGHPVVDGKFVLANTAEALATHYVGAYNLNVERSGDRIYLEKWIDVEKAQESEGGKAILEAIDEGKPIHTSVAMVADQVSLPTPLLVNGKKASWKAVNIRMDHDAILLGEPGAATPEDGVGMLVNSAIGGEMPLYVCDVPMVNAAAILTDSFCARRDMLDIAIREKFGAATGPDNWAYVVDFDDKKVIYSSKAGMHAVSYSYEDGNPILGDDQQKVTTRLNYLAVNGENSTALALLKSAVQLPPVPENQPPQENNQVDETKIAELLANAVAPLTTKLEAQGLQLAALQADNAKLTGALVANQKAADDENRAILVNAKVPQAVIDALSGEALAALAATHQSAAPLGAGQVLTNSDKPQSGLAGYAGV